MADKYVSYGEMRLAEPGSFEVHAIDRNSNTLIMAIHGGKIEPGTTELADAIACMTYNQYTLMGIKQHGNSDLHVTSKHFREPIAVHMASNAEVLVSVHGCAEGDTIFVGGRDHRLADCIEEYLGMVGIKAIGFDAEDNPWPAQELDNICNMTWRDQGVQLEIPRAVRDRLMGNYVDKFIFGQAVRRALVDTAFRRKHA